MSNGENGSLLSGYWAMNEGQRRQQNKALLNAACAEHIPTEIHKKLLEKILLHTLHGKVIAEQLLDEPKYVDYREQLLGVMATLGEREEEIYRLQGIL